ncbi:MAG TPA: LacI family DNA-binding transcriptional regulator [Clostridiales bacterium]|nr:LacI family DNA-binding transcriptional regulator [Clostridiales bacterium]
MATLKDIAEIAGVNVSTVSKALRDSSDINEDTKSEIRKIAKDLDYKFKVSKRNPSNGVGIIGVICPEITSNYYSQIISIIEEEVKKEGYFCIIGFTNFETNDERYYLKHLLNVDVDGIIFITESSNVGNTLSEYKKATSIPLVLVAQNTETKDFDCIKIDDDYGVRLAVEHFIQMGHKDIGYVGDELSNTRLDIFMKVMQENKMKINKKWIQVEEERFEKCGYDLMSSLLKADDIPTAVLAAYDDIAIGAIKAVFDKGLKVPDDISVVGIDNVRISSYYQPELTTIAGPVEEMGKIAVKLLFKKVKDRQYNVVQNVRLSPRLVQRKSAKEFIEQNDSHNVSK